MHGKRTAFVPRLAASRLTRFEHRKRWLYSLGVGRRHARPDGREATARVRSCSRRDRLAMRSGFSDPGQPAAQGLTWSTTVIMKIDLVGPAGRELAPGINEAAGYAAVAATVLATGNLAAQYGLRPKPFLLGRAYAALGLGLSSFAVRVAGTALVYPTLLAAVGDIAHPIWRTRSVDYGEGWSPTPTESQPPSGSLLASPQHPAPSSPSGCMRQRQRGHDRAVGHAPFGVVHRILHRPGELRLWSSAPRGRSIAGTCGDIRKSRAREPGDGGSTTFLRCPYVADKRVCWPSSLLGRTSTHE
jgi:hypothetical protein